VSVENGDGREKFGRFARRVSFDIDEDGKAIWAAADN
jgi:hypothetical protein